MGGRASVLLGVWMASTGCTSDVFVCLADADCGGPGSACEPTGYCSFPDGDCPSGRAYGEHAPPSIQGKCVPMDVGTTSTGDPGSSTMPASSSTTVALTTSSSSTTEPVSDSTGPDPDTNSDTDAPPSLCGEILLEEDFKDGDAFTTFNTIGGAADLITFNGVLEIAVTVGGDPHLEGASTMARFPTEGLLMQVQVLEIPTPAVGNSTGVGMDNGTTQYFFDFRENRIDLERGSLGKFETVGSVDYDPVAHRWVRFRGDDGMLHWEASPDGIEFTELGVGAQFDGEEFFMVLLAGNWQEDGLVESGRARFDDAVICKAAP